MSTNSKSYTSTVPFTSTTMVATIKTFAVVTSRLLFTSSSPAPSEALVLTAIDTLRSSREPQLNDSVKIVNVTYEKISESSYAVIFTFILDNIRIPEDPALNNKTYQQVQDVVNNTLNTLLNDPNSPALQPQSSTFTSSSNQIEGSVGYTFQGEDPIQPVSFLRELQPLAASTTAPSSTVSPPFPIEPQLNDSVKIVNVSFEQISETSYAISFTLTVENISVPEDPALGEDTYQKVEDEINAVLNALLNAPDLQPFEPTSSIFRSSSNQIDGTMGYFFQDGDVVHPVSFLDLLRSQTEVTATTLSLGTTGSPSTALNQRSGSAVVTSRLLFISSSPVPSEALVLTAIDTLRSSREPQLNDSVKIVNVTYEKFSDTSYVVSFKFNVSDISIPIESQPSDSAYLLLQEIISNSLNTLLNEPNSPTLTLNSSHFVSTSNQIDGTMDYVFQSDDPIQPVSYIQQLLIVSTADNLATTALSPTLLGNVNIFIKLLFNKLGPISDETNIVQLVKSYITTRFQSRQSSDVNYLNVTYTRINDSSFALKFAFSISNVLMSENFELRNTNYLSIQNSINYLIQMILNDNSAPQFDLNQLEFMLGMVIIHIELVFKTQGQVPSQNNVLQVANSLLDKLKSRSKRSITGKELNDLLNSVNVTYNKKDDSSFSLKFGFEIVSKILNKTTNGDFNFNQIAFKSNSSVIEATVTYLFSDSDINNYGLVLTFLGVTSPSPTTIFPEVLNTTISSNSTSAAWVVGIIVPCAIVIMLIPCWILLCVLFALWVLCCNQKTLGQETVLQCSIHTSKQPFLDIFWKKIPIIHPMYIYY
ncbi:hypothetical protein DNTS_020827 [Danionella cerebrum]|uniref:SEA domain-containing protein n=1 Tax=Danionella cerebrum TaxID=2873325 RepID=A0A553RBH1_9TELE|nr:hypothetical protein DNTS_020827 [Danionella translucida]